MNRSPAASQAKSCGGFVAGSVMRDNLIVGHGPAS
jgi:hypothetical protein